MKRFFLLFFVFLHFCFLNCEHFKYSKKVTFPYIASGECVVTRSDVVEYRRLDDSIVKIFGNSSVLFDYDGFNVNRGVVLQFPVDGKKDKIIKNCGVKVLFEERSGSAVFIVLKIPRECRVADSQVLIRHYYNDNDEYIQEAKLNYLQCDKKQNYYGFFVPFNLLWKKNRAVVTSEIRINKKSLIKLSAVFNAVDTEFVTQNIRFSPSKSKEIISADRGKYKEEQKLRWSLWSQISEIEGFTKYSEPLDDVRYVTSSFGLTRSWILNNGRVRSKDTHMGIDYYSQKDAPVYSILNGRIVFAGKVEYYGNSVIINHGLGVFSNYCHLNSISVFTGDKVDSGSKIGGVGMTGVATGTHLHHELRVYGIPVNPLVFKEFGKIYEKY